MKKNLFLFVLILVANSSFAINLDFEKIKIKDFNFISEVDYEKKFEKYFDESTSATMVLVPMKDSNDLLITYFNNNELIPILFVEEKNNLFLCKDVNNRKEVLNLKFNEIGKFEVVNFNQNNISNEVQTAGGCLGQKSTFECIQYAVNSCIQDASCAFWCGVTVKYCLTAIAASCAISCNRSLSLVE